jgi:hypothetical protein
MVGKGKGMAKARLQRKQRQALLASKEKEAKASKLGASDNMQSIGQGFASVYRANGVPNSSMSLQWGFSYRKHASMLRKAGIAYSAVAS